MKNEIKLICTLQCVFFVLGAGLLFLGLHASPTYETTWWSCQWNILNVPIKFEIYQGITRERHLVVPLSQRPESLNRIK